MYGEQVFDASQPQFAEPEAKRTRLNHRRSRKACQQCHVRKIRCNVVERGTPCSNCVDAGKQCTIRARKNERTSSNASPSSEHRKRFRERCHSWQLGDITPDFKNGSDAAPQSQLGASPTQATEQAWADFGANPGWRPDPALALDQASGSDSNIDLTYLTDLDNIFSFTRDTMPPNFGNFDLLTPYAQQELDFSSVFPPSASLPPDVKNSSLIGINIPGLSASEEEYLRGQGCLSLPPTPIFRDMMKAYFHMVHPNLPIVIEDQFWQLWTEQGFELGTYSFLLIKAMVFASINNMDAQVFLNMGMTKREARLMYYKQAKILFDFGIEKDLLANAQASLLLTYYSPPYNQQRVNTYWLTQAIRFAKIARADLHYHLEAINHDKSRQLRRLWWGIIMRDRILSLGLRRSMQVPLDPSGWQDEESILTLEDFESELGQSPVHDLDTQKRIVEVLSMTCRLMQTLTRPLQIYRYEFPPERLKAIQETIPDSTKEIQDSITSLNKWHDRAISHFPFPIALDDAHENPPVCVYANLMFCYYSTAIFALNQHLLLLSEIHPTQKISSSTAISAALTTSIHDISRRIQELVQVRLTKYLPISATAFIALPLILQSINVAAAKGTSTEGVENRRLEIFLRTLRAQQENFDGSDHAADVWGNVVAYAQADEKFISSMSSWREGKESGNGSSRASTPEIGGGGGAGDIMRNNRGKLKLDWPHMVFRRPRLFLRLMLHIDHALCDGRPPRDEELPQELTNDSCFYTY